MSYDIHFKVKVQDKDLYVTVGNCYANTTWNVREMIVKSTGLDWKNEEDNGFCKDVIPKIQHGYLELSNKPKLYKQYESPNGWGTIEGTRGFFQNILNAWNDLLLYEPEFVDIAKFWIQ